MKPLIANVVSEIFTDDEDKVDIKKIEPLVVNS